MPISIAAGLILAVLLSGLGTYWFIRVYRPGITDSPWYWGLMFCGAGLIGLLGTGPRYALREAGLERQLEARTEIHRRRADPEYRAAVSEAEAAAAAQPAESPATTQPATAPQVKLLKTLGPLIALASVGALVSAIMLRREQAQLAATTMPRK